MKRSVAPVALVAIAVALGIYLWKVDRATMSTGERSARSGSIFPAWRRGDVSRIELAQGPAHIVLVRDPSDASEVEFTMVEPAVSGTEPAAIDRLLSTLEHGYPLRRLDQPPSDFGAERMHGVIAMGGLHFSFQLGGPAPTPAGAAYFRVNDEKTVVVSGEFASELLRPAEVYRERTVVPYLSIALRELTLVRPAGTLTLVRQDAMAFTIAARHLRASRQKMDLIWSALAALRAESYLPDADADERIRLPAARVLMTPIDATLPRGELIVGSSCPGHPEQVVVVRTQPSRLSVCAPQAILDGLLVDDEKLVDYTLFSAHADEVEELQADRSEANAAVAVAYDFARKENGFHERLPAALDLSAGENEALLAYLSALLGEVGLAVRPGDSTPPGTIRGAVRLTRDHGATTERVVLAESEGKWVAWRESDHGVVELAPEAARALLPHAALLRSQNFWGTDGPLQAITVDCGIRQDFTAQNGIWTLRGGAFPLDHGRVLELADTLRHARALRWTSDASASASTSQPCTIHVTFSDSDAGARALQLDSLAAEVPAGRRADGSDAAPDTLVRARVIGTPGAFLVPRALLESAQRIYAERTVFADVDAAALHSVRLNVQGRPGRSVDLGADAGAAAITLRAELASLRADEVVRLGADRAFVPALSLAVEVASKTRPVRVLRLDAGRDGYYLLRHDGLDATLRLRRSRIDGIMHAFGLSPTVEPPAPGRRRGRTDPRRGTQVGATVSYRLAPPTCDASSAKLPEPSELV